MAIEKVIISLKDDVKLTKNNLKYLYELRFDTKLISVVEQIVNFADKFYSLDLLCKLDYYLEILIYKKQDDDFRRNTIASLNKVKQLFEKINRNIENHKLKYFVNYRNLLLEKDIADITNEIRRLDTTMTFY